MRIWENPKAEILNPKEIRTTNGPRKALAFHYEPLYLVRETDQAEMSHQALLTPLQ